MTLPITSCSELPYAYGEPKLSAVLRATPDDFYVEELLGFEPDGEGEHLFLWIEKTDLNTTHVAREIAKFAGVAARLVSYAGMKDRRARTRQWFSVHLPGKQELDWSTLSVAGLTVLRSVRHRKKLRRGVHRGNRFVIRLTSLTGSINGLEDRLALMAGGVPNYFGEQRFGRAGDNVEMALRWFNGEIRPRRPEQGIYLSAVRSQLFNELLAERVRRTNWNAILPGELLVLAGTQSLFSADSETDNRETAESLSRRLVEGDIHPTGPLFGRAGKLSPGADALSLEQQILAHFPELCDGLLTQRVDADRRALRVIPANLCWEVLEGENGVLELGFDLPRGCFATAVVRELLHYRIG